MVHSGAITNESPDDDASDTRRRSGRSPKARSVTLRLREGDEASLREFFLYFHPLLVDQARLMGVDPDTREEIVLTFLDDKVMELAAMELPPASLTGYVVRGFRNRIRNLVRDSKTRIRIYTEAATEVGSASQMFVAESHSEYGARVAGAASGEIETARPAIARFAQFAQTRLSVEEIQLLVEASRHVPLREVAEWHNMTYSACRVRIHRLRARSNELARQYLRTLSQPEKQEIERFLRRCGAGEE